MHQIYYVYIISNPSHSTFYTGMSVDLSNRLDQHKKKVVDGFSKRYNCNKLLYYEIFEDFDNARHREYQLKRYRRIWKENLISQLNPIWKDLSDDFWNYGRSRNNL